MALESSAPPLNRSLGSSMDDKGEPASNDDKDHPANMPFIAAAGSRKRPRSSEPSEMTDSCDLNMIAQRFLEGDLLVFDEIDKDKAKREAILCVIVYKTRDLWRRPIFTNKTLNCPACYRMVARGLPEFVAADGRLSASSYEAMANLLLEASPTLPPSDGSQIQLELAQFFQRALDKAEEQLNRFTELASNKLMTLTTTNCIMLDHHRMSATPLANNASMRLRGVAISSSLESPFSRLTTAAKFMRALVEKGISLVDVRGRKMAPADAFRMLLCCMDAIAKDTMSLSCQDRSDLFPLAKLNRSILHLIDRIKEGDQAALTELEDQKLEAAVLCELALQQLDHFLWSKDGVLRFLSGKDGTNQTQFIIMSHVMEDYFLATTEAERLKVADGIFQAMLPSLRGPDNVGDKVQERLVHRQISTFYSTRLKGAQKLLQRYKGQAERAMGTGPGNSIKATDISLEQPHSSSARCEQHSSSLTMTTELESNSQEASVKTGSDQRRTTPPPPRFYTYNDRETAGATIAQHQGLSMTRAGMPRSLHPASRPILTPTLQGGAGGPAPHARPTRTVQEPSPALLALHVYAGPRNRPALTHDELMDIFLRGPLLTMADHRPPAPAGRVLSLISALSNTSNHSLHVEAIKARDAALSSSLDSYSDLCLQLAFVLVGCDDAQSMMERIAQTDLDAWRATDAESVFRLEQDPSLFVAFGQMAGLILKNALLRPPFIDHRACAVQPQSAELLKATLLFAIGCQHADLRAVATSIIATSAVDVDAVQPALHLSSWPTLVPNLVDNLRHHRSVEGSLLTVQKMLEDGPHEFGAEELEHLLPALLEYLNSNSSDHKTSALQSFVNCLAADMMPTALVMRFEQYLASLSRLATDPIPAVRQLVCRTIVTLLELRTEYIRDHLSSIGVFMLQSTADRSHPTVALEACEFWLTFAHLPESACTAAMVDTVGALLPQLIPVLLQCMVYLEEQRTEILARNEMDQQEADTLRPIFHRSRAKHATTNDSGHHQDGDDDDDEDFDDDDDGNEWTLRKCAAASLDSLAMSYGAEPILPCLLPALEQGLRSVDPWEQEASILALGAVAEGCCLEMSDSLHHLYPYLMNHLARPEGPDTLPQVKCISAWTIGRYAAWAVEQVQTGAQGNLLAQMTEIFLARLSDRNRRVQVACCSAFGVIIEVAGDLMAPYLEPVYKTIISAMSVYQGRSLLMLFDLVGTMADCCGPAIAEEELPSIYVPPLLQMWNGLAKNDPSDRTLLPLMESLASIAMTSGMNFQPYALECFELAMATIESVTLLLTAGGESIENEEDADPITCSADLLDGLVESMGDNFQALVQSSQRYGPQFLNVLSTLCQHEIATVRMSALALLGDLTRHTPGLLEPALRELMKEAINGMDPTHPQVSTNAVWAIGEICVKCEGNDAVIKPFVLPIVQNLIALLMGNGPGRGSDIPGLAENAAACMGRLAKVNPDFVAPELSRFLLGWCDGMAKIVDPTERRDAFQGFIKTIYANPSAIQNAATNVEDAIASILFCIVTWHFPADLLPESTALLTGEYNFRPFPQQDAELGAALVRLVQDMKASVGEDTWHSVQKELPVNVRRLLRDHYNL